MLPFSTLGVGHMRTSQQINAFWNLAREDSADGERIRRRAAAMGAVALVACGFLFAIGLGLLALAFVAALLIATVLATLLAVGPRLGSVGSGTATRIRSGSRAAGAAAVPVLRGARSASATALTSARTHGSKLAQTTRTGTAAARTSSAGALAVARTRGAAAAKAAIDSGSRTTRELARSARETAAASVPRPDPQQEALRLNATGTQARRERRYDEAVECHRKALDILRTLDDRRAVALTQSNLALALSQSGDDERAIGLFEEAAATLHELGDEEREAQIMANLGIAHRRHGRDEEANNVLELALTKLSPESSAYHSIEKQLQRAS
jgi:tetratricopeptide (TPR) repeat protein